MSDKMGVKKRRPRDRKGDLWKAERMQKDHPAYIPPPNDWMVTNARNGNVAAVKATSDDAHKFAEELMLKGYIDD